MYTHMLPWANRSPHSQPNHISIGSAVFCTVHGRQSLYCTMGRPFSPQNCPVAWGLSGLPHLMHGSLSTTKTASTVDRFSRFCRPHDRDKQTGRPTNRPRSSICNNRPHLRSTAERPHNLSIFISRTFSLYCCSIAQNRSFTGSFTGRGFSG